MFILKLYTKYEYIDQIVNNIIKFNIYVKNNKNVKPNNEILNILIQLKIWHNINKKWN